MLIQVLLVALGSAVGGVARWAAGVGVSATLGSMFPWGTLVVNSVGCFVLGVLMAALAQSDRHVLGWELDAPQREQIRLALGVGFCGGFTTFSTFSVETVKLWDGPREWSAIAYIAASVTLGLLAVRAGSALARCV